MENILAKEFHVWQYKKTTIMQRYKGQKVIKISTIIISKSPM